MTRHKGHGPRRRRTFIPEGRGPLTGRRCEVCRCPIEQAHRQADPIPNRGPAHATCR